MRSLAQTVLFGAALSAFPAIANATPCGLGTLASYMTTGFSCTLGAGTLSNFTLTSTASGGATPLAADDIVIATEDTGAGLWAFQFETPNFAGLSSEDWVATAGQQIDFTISYELSYGPGTVANDRFLNLFADGNQELLGAAATFPVLTGDGLVAVTETQSDTMPEGPISLAQCGPLVSSCPGNAGTYVFSVQPLDSSVSDFTISDAFTLDGGQQGSAEMPGLLAFQFEQPATVPEAPALALLGAGLALLGLFVGCRVDKTASGSGPCHGQRLQDDWRK